MTMMTMMTMMRMMQRQQQQQQLRLLLSHPTVIQKKIIPVFSVVVVNNTGGGRRALCDPPSPPQPQQPQQQPQQQRYANFSTRSLLLWTSTNLQHHLHRGRGGGGTTHLVAPSSVVSFSSSSSSSSEQQQQHEYPPHTVFPMPALSPTMETGSIASWTIAVGDTFSAGDSLCTIETDKASVDFEAQDEGVLAKILVTPGMDVVVGTPICIVTEDINHVPAFANYTAAAPSLSMSSPSPPISETTTTKASSPSSPTVSVATTTVSRNLLFPSARHLAASKGKDATVLQGSGKGGRVTKSDVQMAFQNNVVLPDLVVSNHHRTTTTTAAVAAVAAAAVPPTTSTVSSMRVPGSSGGSVVDVPIPAVTGQTTYEDVPNNKMRKIIASRLTASKRTVPHCYVSIEVALDDIMKLRKNFQGNHGIKISVNDCIIKACAMSLRDVPQVNHMYDTKTDTIIANHDKIDVSVAVATPTGLITPIVFHTDQLGLYEITTQVKDLANRARDGQLQPHEYQGGTFSISNLGMFGINEFSAVINPPQAAIMAVGGGTPTLVPIQADVLYNEHHDHNDGSNHHHQPPMKIQNIMTARLSADRRVIDEATAAMFLQVFRHYMETPELLLL